MFITDVHSLGLKNTEGLLLTTSWDWNLNEQTRAFGKKFFDKTKRMPTDIQAADYSATMTYLKAVQAAKSTDADKVMVELKKMPINDFYAKGSIRADGRLVHDMYLMQVKSPAESTQPWDYYKVVAEAARAKRSSRPRPRASAPSGSKLPQASRTACARCAYAPAGGGPPQGGRARRPSAEEPSRSRLYRRL